MRILNTMAAYAIPLVPRSLIRKISRRYIAGETLSDACMRIDALRSAGFRTTVDVLGETALSSDQAESMARDYLDLVRALGAEKRAAELSIKLTALGLHLDESAGLARVSTILRAAALHGISACIDMETISCTKKPLDAFLKLEADGYSIGIALQAY